ncbi:hypothetical protein B0I35DRAFT_454455 [Stachybotrys elegans]|uniref:CENP-V/GFA domain-containing protein n=1 Tax=Stachybotrys elegans TaxID=80388 RepID=A0A8K0WLE0_9HYPO|nr:hypothetical protein B0I35DRAFT_454455 [Stachybotrys elegans]
MTRAFSLNLLSIDLILSLSTYPFSAKYTVLFCGTCSTPMFFHMPGPEEWFGVFTGTLDNVAVPALFKIEDQIFVGDTIDGGASVWLQGGSESDTKCWYGRQEKSEQLNNPMSTGNQDPGSKTHLEEIPFRCRCGGVDLRLHRGEADFAAMPCDALPWFIDPETYKRHASFDACDSCRLSFGIDLSNWTYSLLKHIDFASGTLNFPRTTDALKEAVTKGDRDGRLGTLAMYESSPDVQRYFCSRCSASVFYACDDRRDQVDVAPGLLECPTGARAEDFLVWEYGGSPSYSTDVAGGWREHRVRQIVAAAEEYRVSRGYPKSWRRIGKEARDT